MRIKDKIIYAVLLASLMCMLGCRQTGAGGKGVLYSKEFYYDHVKSKLEVMINDNWEPLEILKTPFDLQSELLLRFRSEEGCIITIFVDPEHGDLYFNRDQERAKYGEQHWTVHHSLFDMDIYSSENDFMALSDAFPCGEQSMHIIIEGSCNVSRDELESLVLSLKVESQLSP